MLLCGLVLVGLLLASFSHWVDWESAVFHVHAVQVFVYVLSKVFFLIGGVETVGYYRKQEF